MEHPLMTRRFFELGIGLTSHPDSYTVSTDTGEVVMCVEVPTSVEWMAQVNDESGTCITGKTGVMDTRVMPQTPRSSSHGPVSLHLMTIYLPDKGDFDLTFFANEGLCLQYKLHATTGTVKLHPLLTQPLFASLGLELVSHPFSQTLESIEGETSIRFNVPGNVDIKGQISRNDGVNVPGSVATKPSGGVKSTSGGDVEEWLCSVCLPLEGILYPAVYTFNLFAKHSGDGAADATSVLRYSIQADGGTFKQQPFTSLLFEELGLALVTHPFSYEINSPTGEQEIIVKVPLDVAFSGHCEQDGNVLPGTVMSVRSLHGPVMPDYGMDSPGSLIEIFAPQKGEYTLNFFAKPKSSQEKSGAFCLQYKVMAIQATVRQHPICQSIFYELGLGLISHPNQHVIKTDPGELLIEIVVFVPEDVEISGQVEEGGEPVAGAMSTQDDLRGQAFVVCVPSGKEYTLNFFAKRKARISHHDKEPDWCLQYIAVGAD